MSRQSKKLYWTNRDSDGKFRDNMWEVGDQALCMSFNQAHVGVSHNVSNKYYWALVVAVSDNNVNTSDFNWIEISIEDCDGEVNPEVGDEIVMLGHRGKYDIDRQSAVYISSYSSLDTGLQAPFFATYQGIDDFDLNSHRQTYFDATSAKFVGDFEVTSGTSLEDFIETNSNAPKIIDNYWWTWDKDAGIYKNTGVLAEGKDGSTGPQGPKGDTGARGSKGDDGTTYYTWMKYADTSTGEGISDDGTGKKYIGFAYNQITIEESDDPEDYSWSEIKGEKGDTGVQGPKGDDGVTTYTWIKYSEYYNGDPLTDLPDENTKYIGIATNKTTADESSDPADYVWSRFQGSQGIQGEQGPKGENGTTYYTWIKYADSSTGEGISDLPDGKKYIGFAYNKTTQTEGTDPADYTWSNIEGKEGVQGPKGDDGTTYYTWIKYSDKSAPESSDDIYDTPTENTEAIGIATNKTTETEGTDPAEYTWSHFRGAQGIAGTTYYIIANVTSLHKDGDGNWTEGPYYNNNINIKAVTLSAYKDEGGTTSHFNCHWADISQDATGEAINKPLTGLNGSPYNTDSVLLCLNKDSITADIGVSIWDPDYKTTVTTGQTGPVCLSKRAQFTLPLFKDGAAGSTGGTGAQGPAGDDAEFTQLYAISEEAVVGLDTDETLAVNLQYLVQHVKGDDKTALSSGYYIRIKDNRDDTSRGSATISSEGLLNYVNNAYVTGYHTTLKDEISYLTAELLAEGTETPVIDSRPVRVNYQPGALFEVNQELGTVKSICQDASSNATTALQTSKSFEWRVNNIDSSLVRHNSEITMLNSSIDLCVKTDGLERAGIHIGDTAAESYVKLVGDRTTITNSGGTKTFEIDSDGNFVSAGGATIKGNLTVDSRSNDENICLIDSNGSTVVDIKNSDVFGTFYNNNPFTEIIFTASGIRSNISRYLGTTPSSNKTLFSNVNEGDKIVINNWQKIVNNEYFGIYKGTTTSTTADLTDTDGNSHSWTNFRVFMFLNTEGTFGTAVYKTEITDFTSTFTYTIPSSYAGNNVYLHLQAQLDDTSVTLADRTTSSTSVYFNFKVNFYASHTVNNKTIIGKDGLATRMTNGSHFYATSKYMEMEYAGVSGIFFNSYGAQFMGATTNGSTATSPRKYNILNMTSFTSQSSTVNNNRNYDLITLHGYGSNATMYLAVETAEDYCPIGASWKVINPDGTLTLTLTDGASYGINYISGKTSLTIPKATLAEIIWDGSTFIVSYSVSFS